MREKIIEEKLTKAAYLTGFYYCPAADLLSWK